MTDLRENIISEIEHFGNGSGEDAENLADRILAILPPQPKLEWREQYLMIGNLSVGYCHVAGNGWHAHVGIGRHGKYFGPINDKNVARAAVEQAVKEALGWG